jgi:hypothetical protein
VQGVPKSSALVPRHGSGCTIASMHQVRSRTKTRTITITITITVIPFLDRSMHPVLVLVNLKC